MKKTLAILALASPLAFVPARAEVVTINFSGTIAQQINDPSNVTPVGSLVSGSVSYDTAWTPTRTRSVPGYSFSDYGTGGTSAYLLGPFNRSGSILSMTVYDLTTASGPDTLVFSSNAGFLLTLYDPARSFTAGSLPTSQQLAGLTLSGLLENRFGSFSSGPVSISIAGVSAAVPEPAVWIMMILGFGFAGCALRHRRDEGAMLISPASPSP